MKTSRKGTRLNDARYFKNPLPHTRQKMTAMLLLKRVSNLQRKYSSNTEDLVSDVRFDARTKNRGKKINLKDESIEMASVTREDDSRASNEDKFSEGFHREIFFKNNNESLTGETSTSILSEMDETDVKLENSNIVTKKKEMIVERNEIGEDIINDKHVPRENKRHSSRWRNSWISQFIFYLFSQIMGKSKRRDTMNENEEIVVRKSRSYVGYREEEDTMAMDERSHEEIVSTFVRQIQRTRDKNLRVMLLQRELEARLPGENISRSRTYDEKLGSPQLSSPLC